MSHVCNRENCNPLNVNGPKTKCTNCGNLCYLKCFGFESANKINGLDAVKLIFADSKVVYMFVSQLAFACCTDTVQVSALKQALKLPRNRSTSNSRQSKPTESNELSIAQKLSNINDVLAAIKTASDANTVEIEKKLNDIGATTNEIRNHTTVMVDKATRPFKIPSTNQPPISTPNSNRRNPNTQTPSTSYANITRNNQPPNSAKRPRTENASTKNANKPKFNVPPAKIGTKTSVSGLSVIAQPKQIEKPNFSKAVWVSRFSPATTSDEITKYITENSSIVDKTRFNVHKLVKKDQNLSLLKFVSFKIEVNDDDFNMLINEEFWPQEVWVREFLRDRKLGDFMVFPILNANKTKTPSTVAMDITEQSQEQIPSSKLNSPTQT